MKIKSVLIKNDYDKLVFIILKRTLLEFGIRLSNEYIITTCYSSRERFCPESESFYYNMSIWPYDLNFNINPIPVSAIFMTRVINDKSFLFDEIKNDLANKICSTYEGFYAYYIDLSDKEKKVYSKYVYSMTKAIEKINSHLGSFSLTETNKKLLNLECEKIEDSLIVSIQ